MKALERDWLVRCGRVVEAEWIGEGSQSYTSAVSFRSRDLPGAGVQFPAETTALMQPVANAVANSLL